MKLALCGHRIEELPYSVDSESYATLELMLWKSASKYVDCGYDTFVCCASQGTAVVLGEIIAAIKESERLKLSLICVIPYREQARQWDDAWRLRYRYLLHDADRIIQVSDGYKSGCYQKQSRCAVDQSDALLAVYDEANKGRVAYAVEYARKHNKPVEIVNPLDAVVEEQKRTTYY